MIKNLVLLAAFALVPAQDADRGAIELRFGNGDTLAVIVIDPDGTMAIDRPDGMDPAGARIKETRTIGFPGYDRIAALVKPARRWAGGKLPCEEEAFAGGGFWGRPVAFVRWQADGKQVEVPVICRRGPAADEVELIRAAIEQVRNWATEPEPASFDGPANSVYYEDVTGEPD